jgi:hypothetical protein
MAGSCSNRNPAALHGPGDELLWLAFDGEALKFTSGETLIVLPATGTAWDTRYAIKKVQLDRLPKRVSDPVEVSIWRPLS